MIFLVLEDASKVGFSYPSAVGFRCHLRGDEVEMVRVASGDIISS